MRRIERWVRSEGGSEDWIFVDFDAHDMAAVAGRPMRTLLAEAGWVLRDDKPPVEIPDEEETVHTWTPPRPFKPGEWRTTGDEEKTMAGDSYGGYKTGEWQTVGENTMPEPIRLELVITARSVESAANIIREMAERFTVTRATIGGQYTTITEYPTVYGVTPTLRDAP